MSIRQNLARAWANLLPTRLFTDFFDSEKAGGLVLIACTVVSLALANSAQGENWTSLWAAPLGGETVAFWINDALMAVFFLLIGLEIEREVYIGELSDWRNALLPIVAAVGGMAVPAAIHFALNRGLPTQDGVGIPMATDIAFSLGALSLLGTRAPLSLKVFLTALAIIDDLGAILVIAIFYSKGFSLGYFGAAAGVFALMLALNRLKVHQIWVYLVLGAVLWHFMHHSGIHATVAGVLTAFAIPFGDGGERSPSYGLQHFLHKPVAFGIVPLFALANTGIAIPPDWAAGLAAPNSLGILAGLIVGKPIGVAVFALGAAAMGLVSLPDDLRRRHIVGAGLLAGIGFTMSIFVTLLAFSDADTIVESKIAVFAASLAAGGLGFALLKATLK